MGRLGNNAGFGWVGDRFFVNSATGLRPDQIDRSIRDVVPVSQDGSAPGRALFTLVAGDQEGVLFGDISIRKFIEEYRGCGKRQGNRLLERVTLSEWRGMAWTCQSSLAIQLDAAAQVSRSASNDNLIVWVVGGTGL
ncbi:MAG: hypothetical protein ACREXX_04470 [Gammaproteobacteria bacterium]